MRRWLPVSAVIVFLFGLAGVVLYFTSSAEGEREKASDIADIVSLPVALVALAVSVAFLFAKPKREGTPAEVDLTAAVKVLAARVSRDWQQEIGKRGLLAPQALRLRWRAAGTGKSLPSGELGDGTHSFPAGRLVQSFRRLKTRQLAIVGVPGAGKSTLALLFTVAMLAELRRGEPVPVLLSASSWRPAQEPLRAWVARRIGEEYRELTDAQRFGADAPLRMVDGGLILPVLDGLDEIPRAQLAQALQELNAEAGVQGGQFVVTCRTSDYEHATASGRLAAAAVITVGPVPLQVTIAYLTADGERDRWSTVIARMRAEPTSALATALSTPLMISLARLMYQRTESEPDELTRLTTASEVEDHLLRGFLPTIYGPPQRRWLSFLANHLQYREKGADLAWWRLRLAVWRGTPTLLIIALAVLGTEIAFGLFGWKLADDGAFVAVVLAGWAACVAGLNAARTPGRVSLHNSHTTLASVAAAVRDAFLGMIFFPFVLVEAAQMLTAPRPASWEALQNVTGAAALAASLALPLALTMNGIRAWRRARPGPVSSPLSSLWPKLRTGFGTGLLVGLPAGAAVGVFTGVGDGSMTSGMWGGGLVTVAVGAAVGTPIGVSRWLAQPAMDDSPPSPPAAIRGDLLITLLIAGSTAVSAALAVKALAVLRLNVLGPIGGPLPDQWGSAPLLVGLYLFLITLAGSGSHWFAYTTAHLLLMLDKQLPVGLVRFLDDAHEQGILRQAGGVYQFRHARLQTHLAGESRRPNRASARPARVRLRTRLTAVVTVCCLAGFFAVFAVRWVPALSALIDQKAYWDRLHRSNELADAADRLEPFDSDAALRLRVAAAEIAPPNTWPGEDLNVFVYMRQVRQPLTWWRVDPRTDTYEWISTERWIVKYASGGEAVAWDLAATPPVQTRLAQRVKSVRASRDGHLVVLLRLDGSVVAWDLAARPPQSYSLGSDATGIEFGQRDSTWALVQHREELVAWDLASVPRSVELGDRLLGKPRFSGDRWVLAALNVNDPIWNPATGAKVRIDTGPEPVDASQVSRDNRWLVVTYQNVVKMWDLAAPNSAPLTLGTVTFDRQFTKIPHIESVDGRWLLVTDETRPIVAWDLQAAPPKPYELGANAAPGQITSAGNRAVLLTSRKQAMLWDLSTAPPPAVELAADVVDVRLSTDGRWAVVRQANFETSAWNLATATPTAYPLGPTAAIDQITSRWALTRQRDRTLNLWDLSTVPPTAYPINTELTHPTIHISERWMEALGADDRPVYLDLTSATPRAIPFGPQVSGGYSFHADGRAALLRHNNLVVLWQMPLPEAVAPPRLSAHDEACGIVVRPMTKQEWDHHVPRIPYHEICAK